MGTLHCGVRTLQGNEQSLSTYIAELPTKTEYSIFVELDFVEITLPCVDKSTIGNPDSDKELRSVIRVFWEQEVDLNHRHSDFESNELPDCSILQRFG